MVGEWSIAQFRRIFKTKEQRVLRTCTKLYNDAKTRRPGKSEREYLKLILITKPPYDYQYDELIDMFLDECSNIEDLAAVIVANASKDLHGSRRDKHLWESRSRNIKYRKDYFKRQNQQFFKEFWHG